MTPPLYIAVEGVIGVGKTTLAQRLRAMFAAELILEEFEENPFLARFYEDPERYAFPVQVTFLLSRFDQQKKIETLYRDVPVVSDYTFSKDRIFARLNLDDDEWTVYTRMHDVLAERVILPDLIVYLRAGVDTLMDRIARRGRPYERAMPRGYIANLAQAYDAFFKEYHASPVVTIETDAINVVERSGDLDYVKGMVQDALTRIHPAA